MVKIFVAIFSVYFLLLQFIINSQSAPPQVFSYSPVKMSNLTKNSTKLQKCPPCPLVNEKSLTDISSKSICPPQTGKYLTGANVFVNSTSVATNSRGERCCCCNCCCCRQLNFLILFNLFLRPCCCCCCRPCCCCCCRPCCCCCCRPCCCCCRPCCCCCCRPCCCCNCCGCKRHRRQPCTATTMKMVDVLPTPPILMKIKSQ